MGAQAERRTTGPPPKPLDLKWRGTATTHDLPMRANGRPNKWALGQRSEEVRQRMKHWLEVDWRRLERDQRAQAESDRKLEQLVAGIEAILNPSMAMGETTLKDISNETDASLDD
jgi:hypothetical protein